MIKYLKFSLILFFFSTVFSDNKSFISFSSSSFSSEDEKTEQILNIIKEMKANTQKMKYECEKIKNIVNNNIINNVFYLPSKKKPI